MNRFSSRTVRLAFSMAILTVAGAWAGGQTVGGPAYPHGTSHRLAETASQLGLEPERLERARIALRRATEAIDIITSRSSASLSPLLPLWERIDDANAAAAFRFLLEQVRADAADAPSDRVYQWASMLATDILQRLAERNLDEALRLARAWPPPHPRLGRKSALSYRYFEDQIIRNGLRRRAAVEPLEVLKLLDKSELALSFRVRGEVAATLKRKGQGEEGEEVIRTAIELFRDVTADRELFRDYAGMLGTIATSNQQLFLPAFSVAASKNYPLNTTVRSAPGVDGSTIWFTSREVLLLGSLRSLLGRPEVTTKALALAGLEEKVEAVGGLQAFLDSMVVKYPPLFQEASSAAAGSGRAAEGPKHRSRGHGRLRLENFPFKALEAGPYRKPEVFARALNSPMELSQKILLLWRVLGHSPGRSLPAALDAAVRSVLDELRAAVLRVGDFSSDYYDHRPQELRLEIETLPLWAETDFEDTLRRIENHPHRVYRYQILRRVAHRFSRPGHDARPSS